MKIVLHSKRVFLTAFLAVFLFTIFSANAQTCETGTPFFKVDLTGNPDSTWISSSVVRDGKCCGGGGKNNDPCIEFLITLDENTQAIKFFVAEGAKPGGSLEWQLNCGPRYPVDVEICVSGKGPHKITFCKPGNNKNKYGLQAISKPEVSKPTVASNFCTGTLSATNFDPTTIKWTTIFPGARGQYNSSLSCTTGCESITANYVNGLTYLDVEVSGKPVGGCSSSLVTATTRVYFVNDKKVTILPKNPIICFGGTYTQIRATGSGGAPPYTYKWSNGTTGATVNAPAVGWYVVTMSDTTNCPPVKDSVYVTSYKSPILVNAGKDDTTCANNTVLKLAGTLQSVTKARWSGGAGVYSPNDSTLAATYTPTAAEITSKKVRHILTSIDHGSCPAVRDTMFQTIMSTPVVNAGNDTTVCANSIRINLRGTVANAAGGIWSGGTGTYFPNNTALKTAYTPSATEITSKTATLTLTSTGNGKCFAVSDQMRITITDAPTIEAGVDQTVCANNAVVQLNATYTIATGVTWTGGTGTFSNRNIANPTYNPSVSEKTAGKVVLKTTTTGSNKCREVSDSLTIFITPAPTANAGVDLSVCANAPSVSLNGSVTTATGGEWITGTGVFGNRLLLTSTYTPSASEITAGQAKLVLRTTGNDKCLAVTDTMVITITPAPVVDAGPDQIVCGNKATVSLSGKVSVTNTGQWVSGSGTFNNRNNLVTTYVPSPAEIAAGSAKFWLTSTNNGKCNPVTDTIAIKITPAPTVTAGPNQSVCENNSQIQLAGSYKDAGGVIWSGGGGSYSTSNTDPLARYTPSATEILNKTVTLTLTTTGIGNCNAVSSTATFTVTDKPVVNAGQDVSVCANNSAVKLQGSVSVATKGRWSGGTGTFAPNDSTLTAIYTPSASEITNGKATLTLTSIDNGKCIAVSDQIVITITKSPTVNANIDQTVCANNASVNLAGSVTIATGGTWSGGTGTFGSISSLNSSYTPSATEIAAGFADLTLTTTGNGNCFAVSDIVRINITKAPTVDAGPDQTVCANNPKIKLSGAVTIATGGAWSLGTGTYSTSNSDLGATYTPSSTEISAGKVTLRLTSTGNDKCIAVSDDITITITSPPTADAGSDRTVCANNATLELDGKLTVATIGLWSGGNGSFSPNANSLKANYTPSSTEIANGKATLKLTTVDNGKCLAVSDSMVITINPAPIINAGPDNTVCSNNPAINLSGTVTRATGGDWSGGTGIYSLGISSLNNTYTPTATEISSGFITFTLTSTGNGLCLPVSDQVRYTFSASPTVDAGTDKTTCSNNPVVSLTGIFSVSGGVTWSGGNGTFSAINSATTTYTPTASEINTGSVNLTLTTTQNGTCNPVSDQVKITYTPAPTADAGADRTVCSNNPVLTLAGSVTVAPGGSWTGGTGTFSNRNSLISTYTPSAAELTAGKVNLTLTTTAVNNCIAVSDVMTITITPAPTTNLGSDLFVCGNNPSVNLNAVVTVATGGKWITGAGTFLPNNTTLNAQYTPSAAEISNSSSLLIFETTGNGNCLPKRDTLLIVISPAPTTNAGKDTSTCKNNPSITLYGLTTNATGRVWSGGAGTFTPNANALNAVYTPTAGELLAGQVTLNLTASKATCTSVSDDIIIKFTPTPIVDAGPDQTICSNNPKLTVNGTVTTAKGGTWSGGKGTWSPSANSLTANYTPTAEEISSGSLKLVLTSTGNGNCIPVSDTMKITFTPKPTALPGSPQSVCANKSAVSLNGNILIATGGIWSGGQGGTFSPNNADLKAIYTPSAADKAAGFVNLKLTTSGNGNCLAVTDSVRITITEAPDAYAGEDVEICANNAKAVLQGVVKVSTGGTWSGGNGILTPDADSLNATYTPTAEEIKTGKVTLTLVTTGNGNCNLVTDNINITITPAPTIDAGPDQTVCGNTNGIQLNGSVTISNGGLWVSGGTGTFSPNANTLNANYIPSSADITKGSVNLTLTSTGNGKCLAVSDGLIINFTPAPSINSGPDQTVCSNSFPVHLNAIGSPSTWSGGNGTFSPGRSVLNPTYTPTQSEIDLGFVLLNANTLVNGTCASISDQIRINLKNGPVVLAGSDNTVCGDVASVKLDGTVQNAGGAIWTTTGKGAFMTSASTLPGEYVPHKDDINVGPVRFVLTSTNNGLCKAETDTMFLTFTSPPTINAGIDRTICADKKTIDLVGQLTVATGAAWTTSGKGTFSNPTSLTTTYTFAPEDTVAKTVSFILSSIGNGTCKPVTAGMKVTITPAPKVFAGNDITICADSNRVNLAGNVTTATGGIWTTDGNGTFSPNNATLATAYYITPTDTSKKSLRFILTTTGNGTCNSVSDTLSIKINSAPFANAGIDQVQCADKKTVTLNGKVTNATGGTWTSTGTGSFNNSATLNPVYSLSSKDSTIGSVTLTLTTTGIGTCKAVTDQMIISLTPAPTANAGADQTVCANNPIIKLAGKVTVATGGTWSNGSGTYTPHPNSLTASYRPSAAEIAAGKATLVLSTSGNGSCNTVRDTIKINITPSPVVNPGPNTTVCGDIGQVQLSGSVQNATGGIWSTSGTGYFTPSEYELNANYVPSVQDTANKNVTLTLTSQGNGNCLAVANSSVLTLTPAPTVNAGPTVTVCGNNAEVQLEGKVTVATGGIWTGGSGSFNPSNTTLNTIYTPSADEINNGSVTLTLTTTGMGSCKAASAKKTIIITPAPTVFAGPDLNVCANNPIADLSGTVTIATGGIWSGYKGTITPANTSLKTRYTLDNSEILNKSVTIFLTTTGNGQCKPVTDTVKINVTPSPIVDAGADQNICADSAQVLLTGKVTGASGVVWTTNGTGTLTLNPNLPNSRYIPSNGDKTKGSVKLIITTEGNGNCLAVSDTMLVNISPAPTADAGIDQTICANNSAINLTGKVTVATGGRWTGGSGIFNPSANSLTTTYSPSASEIAAGSVTLTLETTGNGTCKAVKDNISIAITPSPVVNAGPDKSVCENNPIVSLSGNVTIATGATWSGNGVFTPSNSSLASSYHLTPTEVINKSAVIILTSTGNGNCLPVSDTVLLKVTPAPTAFASSNLTICADSALVKLDGIVTVATSGNWSTNGSGSFSPNANSLSTNYIPSVTDRTNGNVLLTLTTEGNGNCLAVTNNVAISITPAPTVDAGPDITICADAGSVNLNANVTVATGVTWSGGNGTFNNNNTTSTSYSPSASEITNGGVTLFAISTGNGSCKVVKDAINIKITPAPTANAGFDQEVCAGAGSVNLAGKVTIATGGIWTSTGTGNFIPGTNSLAVTYQPSSADTTNKKVNLILTSTGNGNCQAVNDTIAVTFTPVPVVDAGVDKTICADAGNIQLNDAKVSNASGGKWLTDGDGVFSPNSNTVNATYTPSQADIARGSVNLTLTSTGNGICTSVSDNVQITITPAPTVNAGINDTICANSPIVKLKGTFTVAGGAVWSTGSGLGSFSSNTDLNATFTADPAQINAGIATIILTTTGNGTCKPVTSRKFVIFKPVPVITAGPHQTICEDLASIKLNASVTNASSGTWTTSGSGTFSNNQILNPVYTLSNDDKIAGHITLKISSTGNGVCNSQKDSLIVKINKAPTVDAGPAAICSNAAGIKLDGKFTNAGGVTWTTTGTGSFQPSANFGNPTFNPSAADVAAGQVILRLTTTGNGPCRAVKDSVILSITPVPSADAGADQIVCANTGDVQLAGKIVGSSGGTWTSSGGGNFSPNASSLNAKYTPSANDITNGKVTLTLTTTGVGLCSPASDQMVISVTPAPTSDPGLPQTVCADTAGITLKGKVTVATGGVWSSTTGGSFSPAASNLNTVYKPSATDIAIGKAILTLTTTGNGNCIPVNQSVEITVTPAPTANAGPDQVICGDVNQIVFHGETTVATSRRWGTSGSGTITPDNFSEFVTYNVTPADTAKGSFKIYFRTQGNGMCKPVSDTANVTITPAPRVAVSAGGICADKDTIQINGKLWVAGGVSWSTSGSGTWDPDSLNLNPKYIPSVADKTAKNVTLTITTTNNGTCTPARDSIAINISPAPAAFAGNDITICAENSGITLNGSVQNAGGLIWNTIGKGSFDNPSIGNATYFVSPEDTAAHQVKLVISTTGTGSCATVSDTVIVNMTPTPVVNAAPEIICTNSGIGNMSGRVYNATGMIWSSNGDGNFSNALTNPENTYTFGPNDNITEKVTIYLRSTGNGICTQKTDSIVINMADAPVAKAGGTDTICADASGYNLSGFVENSGGLMWHTLGTGKFDVPTSATAVYDPSDADTAAHFVQLVLTTTSNGFCAAVTDTFDLHILPTPIVDAGPATVCSNNPSVNLEGSVKHAGGVVWTKSTGADGTFGNSTSLVTTYTPGALDIVNKKVTLYLTSTDMKMCNPVTDSLVLLITEPPTPTAGAPVYVCADEKTIQLNGIISGAATGGEWSALSKGSLSDSSDLNAVYTMTSEDTVKRSVSFVLKTTGNGNCKAVTDTIEVEIKPAPVVFAGTDQTVCSNVPAVTLLGKVFNAGGAGWTTSGTGSFMPDTSSLVASYRPSSADTASGTVTLTFTSTLNDRCSAVSDSLIVKFDKIPAVDAGPATICTVDPGINLHAIYQNAGGVLWSTSGDGSFAPNATGVDVIYIVSSNDTASKKVTITLTTTGNGACSAATDKIEINLTPPPVVTAGASQTLCADANIQLVGTMSGSATGVEWTTNGNGTWNPGIVSQNTTYIPSATEAKTISDLNLWFALTTTGTAPCAPVSDTVFVTLTPAPVAVVNAGNDTTLCADKPNIPLKGSISVAQGGEWTSSGNGIFTPNAYTLEATYLPDSSDINAGSIKIALSTTGNGMCNPVTDTIIVSFTNRPLADAGPDETVCQDVNSITLNGKVTTATGGKWYSSGSGSFDDDSTLAATYTVSVGDIDDSIIILTLESTGNGACQAAYDNKILYVRPAPIVNAGFDKIICADNRILPITGQLKYTSISSWSTNGTGTISPNKDSLTIEYSLTDADTTAGEIEFYLSTPSSDGCFAKIDTMLVSITDAPTADPGLPQTVCSDVEGVTISGKVTVGSGGMWTTSGTGYFAPNASSLNAIYVPSPLDTTTGKVTLSLETTGTGDCDPVTQSTEITLLPIPVVNAGDDAVVCANAPEVTLSATVHNATGGIWSGGSGKFSTSDTDLNTIYTPSEEEISAGFVNLTLTSTGMGTCNPVRDQVSITITPAPVVEAGPDMTICSNNPAIALSGFVSVATGGKWTAGTGVFVTGEESLETTYNPTLTEITNKSLKIVLTSTGNGKCKEVKDSLMVTFTDSPVVTADPIPAICADRDSITLKGSVTIANGAIWSTSGSGTFSPVAEDLNALYTPSESDKKAGKVELILTSTGNGNCLAVSNTTELIITPTPTVDAGSDQIACGNNPVINLAGIVTIASGGTWSGGAGTYTQHRDSLKISYTPTLSEIQSGSVTLNLTTTGNGTCKAVKDFVKITYTDSPKINAGADVSVCANNPVIRLTGYVELAGGGIWSGGNGSFDKDPNNLAINYTPSVDEISDGKVKLAITTTQNGNCIAVSDSILILITPAPVAEAGPNIPLCADKNTVDLSGSIQIAGGGIWSSSGTGIFAPDENTLEGTYVLSEQDRLHDSLKLILTTTANGNCLAVKDSTYLLITPKPTITAGTDQIVCGNNSMVDLLAKVTGSTGGTWSGGNGSYTTSADSLKTIYNPSATEITNGFVTLTVTSTGNGLCNAVSDQMAVTITPSPGVDAGEDRSICFNNADALLKGLVSVAKGGIWSGGSGSYTPSPTSLTNTYSLTSAEKSAAGITMTLTSTQNGNCLPVADNMNIIVRPAPVVNAGVNQTVCADVDSVMLSGTVTIAKGGTWSSSGTGYFTPNPNVLNAKYIPSDADRRNGNVSLTLTSTGNENCLPVSSFMLLKITPAPTVNAGEDFTICADSKTVQLSGKITTATGGSWTSLGTGTFNNTNNLNPLYTLSDNDIATGKVVLQLKTTGNGKCKEIKDNIIVNVTPAPTIEAGTSKAICADAETISLNGSVTVATGASWTTSGTGSFENANALSTSYTLSAADTARGTVIFKLTSTGNGDCKTVTDSVQILINPAPIVSTGDETICSDLSGATITGRVYNASGVKWTTSGSGSFAPNAFSKTINYTPSPADIANGFVRLKLESDGHGTCKTASTEMRVIITPLPVANAGEDKIICRGSNTLLVAKPVAEATYAWYTTEGAGIGNEGALLIQTNRDTSFILGVTDRKGCFTFDTVEVKVTDPPVMTIASHFCFDPQLQIIVNLSEIPAVGGFQWYRNDTLLYNETSTSLTVKKPGQHIIGYSYGSCSVFDTTTVTAPPVGSGEDMVICLGDSATLKTTTISKASYQWFLNASQVGKNRDSIRVFAGSINPVDYIVKITDSLGCIGGDTINFSAINRPLTDVPDIQSCIGNTEELAALAPNTNLPTIYRWFKNGQLIGDQQVITVNTDGYYTLKYTVGNCYTTDSGYVKFNVKPIPVNMDTVKFCNDMGTVATLDAGPGTRYKWLESGSVKKDTTVNTPGYHYFEVFNEFNCSVTDSIFALNTCPPRLFIPDAFTPDCNPAINNCTSDRTFKIFGGDYTDFSITIYNRWGEIIFYSTDPDNGWDGRYLGEPMPAGVYPYIIKYKSANEEFNIGVSRLEGRVILIR